MVWQGVGMESSKWDVLVGPVHSIRAVCWNLADPGLKLLQCLFTSRYAGGSQYSRWCRRFCG